MIKLRKNVATSVAVALCAVTGIAIANDQEDRQSSTAGTAAEVQQGEHEGRAAQGAASQTGEAASQRSGMTGSRMAQAGALDDGTFVEKAAQSSLLEIEASRLALNNARDPQVRQFAQRMIKDHGLASSQLTRIAEKHGLDVPRQLDSRHMEKLQELKSQSGSGFDAAYVKLMNDSHGRAVQMFEQASESAQLNEDLRAFASQTLPTLQTHEQLAGELRSSETRHAEAPTTGSESEPIRR